MTQVLERRDEYLAQFQKLQKELPGSELPWLKQARAAALARFAELGLPTEEDESWRFTRVDAIEKTSFAPASGRLALEDSGSLLGPRGDAVRLVFVDGRIAPELSVVSGLPPGVLVSSLAAALKADPERVRPFLAEPPGEAFGSLNGAFFSDGAFILLPAGVCLERPIHLHFVSTAPQAPTMSHGRVIVALERGASAVLIEEYSAAGSGVYFTNMVSQARLGENARLEHYKIGRDGSAASHVASLLVFQARDSRFTGHNFSFGGGLVRNDAIVRLEGEGAECALNGLYLADGRRHVDNHTLIDHQAPHGTSRELYKGVLDGRARAVFNGMISVAPAAQKTDAQVYNKNLLLSEHGVINTKPEFKINANDVQCKHGATIGQLSQDALFYLRSRGIEAPAARRMLVYAFASEMIERVSLEPLREALTRALDGIFHD